MITKGNVTAAIARALAALCAMTAAGCLLGEDIETLEAKAVGGTYTVTFNANNGSGTAPGSQTVEPGSSVTLPDGSGLTRTDYFFGGWNTNASGAGTNYAAGASYTPTGNVTLYAQWHSVLVPGATLTAKLNWLQANAVSNADYTLEVSADESIPPKSFPITTRVTSP